MKADSDLHLNPDGNDQTAAGVNALPPAEAPPWRFMMPFIIVAGLHLIGGTLPVWHTWGFNHWEVVSQPWGTIIPAVVLLLLIPPVYSRIFGWIGHRPQALFGLYHTVPNTLRFVIGTGVMLVLLFLMRSRAHVYGDGFLILDHFLQSDQPLSLTDYHLKPLAYFLQRAAFGLAAILSVAPTATIFSLTSIVGGLVGWAAVYKTARLLFSVPRQQWLVIMAAATSGSIILFFGYVEYYTWATALGLWSLYFSLSRLRGSGGSVMPIVVSAVAVGFHIMALPFLVAALMAVMTRRDTGRLPFGANYRLARLIAVLGSFMAALAAQLLDLPQWLMLIWPIEGVPYSAFSWAHAVDILNHLLLVAPVAAILLVDVLLHRRRTDSAVDVTGSFLATVSLLLFLSCFWLEPKLGAVRDWDIISFYGIPFSLWAGSRIVQSYGSRMRAYWPVAMLLVVLVHIAPNLYEKIDLTRAARHLDGMLWDSPHHQIDYGEARRCLSWGMILNEAVGAPDLADKHFRRRLEVDSACASSCYNLGEIQCNRRDLDSAAYFYTRAIRIEPQNPFYLYRLADVEDKRGRLQNALGYIMQSVTLHPDHPAIQTKAGVILSKSGHLDRALQHFRAAIAIDRRGQSPVMNMGIIFAYRNEYDSAYFYLTRAKQMQPDNPLIYEPLVKTTIALGKLEEARSACEILARLKPAAPSLQQCRQLFGAEIR